MNQSQVKALRAAAESGKAIKEDLAMSVLSARQFELPHVLSSACQLKHKYFGNKVSLCSIMNIKCGACKEDCAFCAQSARYPTKSTSFGLLSVEEMVKAYDDAVRFPIKHFSLVASGRVLGDNEIKRVCQAVRSRSCVAWCVSLGCLGREQLDVLKKAGVKRVHHNLETAETYFPSICSTHSFADRLKTLKLSRESGLEICSGGILGMGESLEQRVEFAATLASEKVTSIPLNVLIPIPGTPLGKQAPMTPMDMIRSVAMFRFMNPSAEIRICAGREHLRYLQPLVFYAGATGMMFGSLLTVSGIDMEQDLQMLSDLEVDYEK